MTIGVFSYAFLGCDETKIAVTNFNEDSCSQGCKCDFNPVFSPVCGSDGLTYVSPCYVRYAILINVTQLKVAIIPGRMSLIPLKIVVRKLLMHK